MALTLTVTPGTTYPTGTPVDRAELRRGANPSATLDGTIEADDLGAAAVQPRHLAPAAFLTATTSGNGAAYVATSANNSAAVLTDALWVWVVPHVANTGACTLDLDGLGAKHIKMPNGTNVYANALVANTPALIAYHSAIDAWVLCSHPGNGFPIHTKGSATVVELTISSVSTINVVADSAVLTDPTTGAYTNWGPVDVDASIASLGAGGRDAGAEASATKYYVYLVSDGLALHCMLSTSGSAPSKTTFAWTSKLLIGAVYNDASGDLSDSWCDWPTPRFVGGWADPAAGYSVATVTHNLGRRPKLIRVELKCAATGASMSGNYTVGDVIDALDTRQYGKNGESAAQAVVPVGSETTAVKVLLSAGVSVAVNDGTLPSASSGIIQLENGGTVHWQYRLIVEA